MKTPNCNCNYCQRRCSCMGCNGYDQGPASHCGGCRKVDREDCIREIIKTLEEESNQLSLDVDHIFADAGAGIVDDSLAAEPELLAQMRRRLKGKVAELSVLLKKAESDVQDIYYVQDKMYGGGDYYRSANKIKNNIETLVNTATRNFEKMLIHGFRKYGELPPPPESDNDI